MLSSQCKYFPRRARVCARVAHLGGSFPFVAIRHTQPNLLVCGAPCVRTTPINHEMLAKLSLAQAQPTQSSISQGWHGASLAG
jgi:hypothetical protein